MILLIYLNIKEVKNKIKNYEILLSQNRGLKHSRKDLKNKIENQFFILRVLEGKCSLTLLIKKVFLYIFKYI